MKIGKSLCIALCILFAGCYNKEASMDGLNKTWNLAKMEGKTFSKPISINFNSKKNSFYGDDGCNNIFGSFELKDDKLKLGNINSTMMACEDMKTPLKYTKLLKRVKYYRVDGGFLTLLDKDKNALLEYMAK